MDAVEDIKSRLDIADVVQEYLPLKPAGSGSFKGLCPFHHERTPSFYVNRPRQSWHCFGCDQGGDAIAFVMRMEGMEFREALELLANKVGVTLPQFDAQKTTEKKRLFEVNDLASRWFRGMLLSSPEAEHARAYVAKRGIDDLTGDLWRIGYAPDSWSALTEALVAKGVTIDELIKAGLVGKRGHSDGVYDRFRDRVMFTIWDVHGNIVGFTGRILDADKKEAKYVNTPETSIYKKSAVLYGLDKARGEIKRADMAVIVEGNMDALSSHQFGVTNVIASSGTALTAEQLSLLKRFTRNLAIAFDQDVAGMAATVRGLDLARSLDFNIRIITLPPGAGKDPDEAVRKDPAIWQKAIHDAQAIIDWLYQQAFRQYDRERPEQKKMIARELLPELKRIPDPVERDAWMTRLARDLAISEDALRDALRQTLQVVAPTRVSTASLSGQEEVKTSGAQAPRTREEQLIERILAVIEIKPELEPLALERLSGYPLAKPAREDLSTYLAIFADREFEDQSLDGLTKELETTCADVRKLWRQREGERLEQEMRAAELAGDEGRIRELLAQVNQLM